MGLWRYQDNATDPDIYNSVSGNLATADSFAQNFIVLFRRFFNITPIPSVWVPGDVTAADINRFTKAAVVPNLGLGPISSTQIIQLTDDYIRATYTAPATISTGGSPPATQVSNGSPSATTLPVAGSSGNSLPVAYSPLAPFPLEPGASMNQPNYITPGGSTPAANVSTAGGSSFIFICVGLVVAFYFLRGKLF